MKITLHGIELYMDGDPDEGWDPDPSRSWTIVDVLAFVDEFGTTLRKEWPENVDPVFQNGVTLPEAYRRTLADDHYFWKESREEAREQRIRDLDDAAHPTHDRI